MEQSSTAADAKAGAARLERARSARGALASLALAMLLSSLGTSIANVGLPEMIIAFGASFQAAQWVVLAYLLAITTLIVTVGRLGDIVGRRRLMLAGVALFTAASILCSLAPTLWVLVAARAVQGLGAAIMMALAMALVGETVPKERTGSAMGLIGTMSAIGTALGPSLGGMLIAGYGWPAIFLINVPLGLAALALGYRFLPEDRADMTAGRPGFDVAGTLLLALSLGAYALAMTPGRGSFGALNGALLAAAVVGLVAFVRVESRASFPLIRLAMLRQPALGAGLATSMLVSTVIMTTLVVGPFYLSRALGLEPVLVGAILSIGPMTAALTGIPAGRLADRLGPERTAAAGLVGMIAGCLMLAAMPTDLGVTGYVMSIVVMTSSYALFQTANNTAVMSGITAAQRGVISGMLNLSRNLGLVTGASAMGAVFSLASGSSDVAAASPDVVAVGMHVTFAVAGALVVVALAITATGRIVTRRQAATAARP